MTNLIDNWYVIVVLIIFLIVIGGAVFSFIKEPSSVQMRKVQEWLLLAVSEAENQFGGGTGELKLRYVYDLFVMRFPWLARAISFDVFAEMVDSALLEMKRMLTTNPAAARIIAPGDDL